MAPMSDDPVTPWTTEGDEDDAPWFDPPEPAPTYPFTDERYEESEQPRPEPVPTITKVAYLIPVTQQMLDDMPTLNMDEMRHSRSTDRQESLQAASDYEPSCCAYCAATAGCDCEQIEDLPGMWAPDDKDESTDV